MAHGAVGIGLVGCGMISEVYLRNLTTDPLANVVACADLDHSRAVSRAREFNVPRALSPDELIRDPEVEVVCNLTWPRAHAEVSRAALAAGKHVFSEKPLATDLEAAALLKDTAARSGLRIGCAPDTILGDGMQSALRLAEDGSIGEPLGGAAWSLWPHPVAMHPAPQFLYQPGGGPLLDMGPYYIAALVSFLGPVEEVAAFQLQLTDEQELTFGPNKGTRFPVQVPTWTSALLSFVGGHNAQLVTTWEVLGAEPYIPAVIRSSPPMQIWARQGLLIPPDPSGFARTFRLHRQREEEVATIEVEGANTPDETHNYRGLGLREMLRAIRDDRPHALGIDFAYHILEVTLAIGKAAKDHSHVRVDSRFMAPPRIAPELAGSVTEV